MARTFRSEAYALLSQIETPAESFLPYRQPSDNFANSRAASHTSLSMSGGRLERAGLVEPVAVAAEENWDLRSKKDFGRLTCCNLMT